MEPKKISFGFSKVNKKPNIIISNKIVQKPETSKVELIKCLEGQEIKLVEEKPEETPLVILLKENQKTSAALASLMKRRAVLLGVEEPMESSTLTENGENTITIINETDDIEKRAAQELLAELNANNAEKFTSDLILPIVHPDDLPLEGAKESSLDDYDDIPVEQFGKAMLRGMGWSEPPKPAKGVPPLDDSPMVRPKGMGLGADKALKVKPLLVAPESNEVLQVKRNAFVRILGGKHKDLYGQIEGFDDHAGRVIVKMAIGGFKEAFNEFLCQPVSKKEYAQYGKCINSTKYEEYKRKENEHGQIILKKEEIAEIDKKSIKYKKLKRETKDLSSDEDCKIIEKNQLKTEEASSGSREQKIYYNDRNIKDKRNYKNEYKRKEEHGRNRGTYKEGRLVKRENCRDYDGDRKRDAYNKNEKNCDGSRHKERVDEDSREIHKDYQNNAFGRNYNKDSESNRARSRERYDSKYSNKDVERRRDSNPDYSRVQRQDYRHKGCDERKNRPNKVSESDESDDDDRKKYKKSRPKDKKTKKGSKSKKSKSKYEESSDSESSTSTSSSTSDSEEERRKKHKKKTKKSKKERERSRSRGRR